MLRKMASRSGDYVVGYLNPLAVLLLVGVYMMMTPPSNTAECVAMVVVFAMFACAIVTPMYFTWALHRAKDVHERKVAAVWSVHGPALTAQGLSRGWLSAMGETYVAEMHRKLLSKA